MNKRLNNKNTCSTDLSGLLEGSNEIMHMKALCKLQSTIQMQITPSFGGNYYSNYYYYFHGKGGEEGEAMAPQLGRWELRLQPGQWWHSAGYQNASPSAGCSG